MTPNLSHDNATSLTEKIADVVRERILTGEYEIGTKIKENVIADELCVSRTPIREAFKQLENEGLIDYIPNRGCFAKGFTKSDISDIYEVRRCMEDLAIRWAVDRITPEEVAQLDEQCDLMELYTKKKDSRKIMELNSVFHNIIYNAARSRFLAQILRSYNEYIDKTRKYIFYKPSYLDSILLEHREILDAIQKQDTEKASEAMRKHLLGSQERAETVWNAKE